MKPQKIIELGMKLKQSLMLYKLKKLLYRQNRQII
jgi:hypothetical protein